MYAITHTHSHSHTHSNSSSSSSIDDNELDDQLAEAVAAQNEYNDWKSQLAATCVQQGIAMPAGYALQREWNKEQKQRAERRKAIAAVERRKATILAQMKKLANELQQLDAQLAEVVVKTIQTEREEQLPNFDNIDAELLRLQQEKELQTRLATREQHLLFDEDAIMKQQQIGDDEK